MEVPWEIFWKPVSMKFCRGLKRFWGTWTRSLMMMTVEKVVWMASCSSISLVSGVGRCSAWMDRIFLFLIFDHSLISFAISSISEPSGARIKIWLADWKWDQSFWATVFELGLLVEKNSVFGKIVFRLFSLGCPSEEALSFGSVEVSLGS